MQNAGDDWLNNLAKRVIHMTDDDFYTAAVTHYTECLLGGATTAVDCLYLVKDERVFDAILQAARDVGIRLILVRSSMDKNPTGSPYLAPFIQARKDILSHSEALIKKYHDAQDNSMLQIGLGPCSLSSGSAELYRETARLARKYGVRLYTLLGEDKNDRKICEQESGSFCRYMKQLGWSGPDIVFVNCVDFNDSDLDEAKDNNVNIVDCPRSNARGTGITKLTEIIEKGIPLGIGTAGAAGNDAICMQDELVWARYSQGMRGRRYLDSRLMLQIASEGGAKVLGRSDLIWSDINHAKDKIRYDIKKDLSYAGAFCDPIGSLVGSGKLPVRDVIVNGKIIIREHELDFMLEGKTAVIQNIWERQQTIAAKLDEQSSVFRNE